MELLSKFLFFGFTLSSLLCYGLALLLFYLHLTDNTGMPLLFFMPLLVLRLVIGLLALIIKRYSAIEVSRTTEIVHKIHLVVMSIGAVALVYTYFSE